MFTTAPLAENQRTFAARQAQKAVVFYDGGCPLCSREIAHYRRCHGAEDLESISPTNDSLSGDCGVDVKLRPVVAISAQHNA